MLIISPLSRNTELLLPRCGACRSLTPYEGAAATAVTFDHSGLFLAVGGPDARVYGVKQDWEVLKTFPDLPKKVRSACYESGQKQTGCISIACVGGGRAWVCGVKQDWEGFGMWVGVLRVCRMDMCFMVRGWNAESSIVFSACLPLLFAVAAPLPMWQRLRAARHQLLLAPIPPTL